MGAPSKDFRDYYGGKEAHSFLRPAASKRERTRGEKIADACGRLLMLAAVIASNRGIWWLVAISGSAVAMAGLTEWWLKRRDEHRVLTEGAPSHEGVARG